MFIIKINKFKKFWYLFEMSKTKQEVEDKAAISRDECGQSKKSDDQSDQESKIEME